MFITVQQYKFYLDNCPVPSY